MKSILLVLTSSYLASCLPPPHPAVVAVRREEEQLPLHLRKPALWNPHLREILPLTSLLHEGESPVFEREADIVSRQEIYNILTHAGFLPRRHPLLQPDPHHKHNQRLKLNKKTQQLNQQFSGGSGRFGGQNGNFGSHHLNTRSQIRDQHYNQFYSPYLDNPDFLQYL